VTSLSDLVSSSLITISIPTFTVTELTQALWPISLEFNGTTYPLTSNATTSTIVTGATLTTITPISPFMTFYNNTFSLAWPSSPQTLNVEAPCTSGASSFDYTLTPSLPPWLTCTPTNSTSTQTFTIEPSSLSGDLVSFNGELTNTQPFNITETLSR